MIASNDLVAPGSSPVCRFRGFIVTLGKLLYLCNISTLGLVPEYLAYETSYLYIWMKKALAP